MNQECAILINQYGQHQYACSPQSQHNPDNCDCGFNAVVKAALAKEYQRGIERAREVVEAAEERNQHHRDLQQDILDALTEARTETEEGG